MPGPIEIGFDALMRQATMTAHDYMRDSVENIDKLFGEGYAKKHPELVVGYMRTAAADLGAAILAQQVRAGLDAIAEAQS
jgi:hypothetical protein